MLIIEEKILDELQNSSFEATPEYFSDNDIYIYVRKEPVHVIRQIAYKKRYLAIVIADFNIWGNQLLVK